MISWRKDTLIQLSVGYSRQRSRRICFPGFDGPTNTRRNDRDRSANPPFNRTRNIALRAHRAAVRARQLTLRWVYKLALIGEHLKEMKSLSQKGRCLHFEAGERCNRFVDAHSIQRSGQLKKIAECGQTCPLFCDLEFARQPLCCRENMKKW